MTDTRYGEQQSLAQAVRYPSLYQINTRVWLTELARKLGRAASLDDIPDAELERLRQLGFDWIWLLSVWQTGSAGQRVSRAVPAWRKEFEETLPDLHDDDVRGSGFAITRYVVHEQLGGDAALARLRERLALRGLRLMLDFVPNHTALDHHWVEEHPEYYVSGSEADLLRAPQNYARVTRERGALLLAHGRDPYFDGWPDTLQLDYGKPETQDAMLGELLKVAGQCDGVRCDMAMLLLPEVFMRTWARKARPFWPGAIQAVRARSSSFCFLAEVYWDLEGTLLQQGFDYAYDKRLYDCLRRGHAAPVREQLRAGLDHQDRLARFLENHDESRAATSFAPHQHQAAALLTFLAPGLRLFHQGQLDGRRKRISPHLVRAPDEPVDLVLSAFYERLLALLQRPAVRSGAWQLLECVSAWHENASCEDILAWRWQEPDGVQLLVAVNFSDHPSQGRVRAPFSGLFSGRWQLRDVLGESRHERDADDLEANGLYLDMTAWQGQVFEIVPVLRA